MRAMPVCLMSACRSAPDVAYAIEFGSRWCDKAGVDVSETLALSENYTQGLAREYFQYVPPSPAPLLRYVICNVICAPLLDRILLQPSRQVGGGIWHGTSWTWS